MIQLKFDNEGIIMLSGSRKDEEAIHIRIIGGMDYFEEASATFEYRALSIVKLFDAFQYVLLEY